MNNSCKEEYAARIANATPLQLVIINYEIIFDYIKDAKENIENAKPFNFALNQARMFLSELRNSLDMSYDISKSLAALYNYVDQQISYYSVNKKEEHINECEKVLSELLDGWKAIENKEEDKTPIMQNTQQLYAGLTYGKGGRLNEYVEPDTRRGFKA